MKSPTNLGTSRSKALGARRDPLLPGSAAVKSRMAQRLRVLLANIARTATRSEAARLQDAMVVTVEAAVIGVTLSVMLL